MWSRIAGHATFMHDDSEQKLWMSTEQCPCLPARGGCCRHQEWEGRCGVLKAHKSRPFIFFRPPIKMRPLCFGVVLWSKPDSILWYFVLPFRAPRTIERKKEEWEYKLSEWALSHGGILYPVKIVKKTIEEKWKVYTTEIHENVSYIFLHVLYLLITKERKQIEKTYKPPFLWRNQ